ncbi:tRNA (adenosine(37)-N6)-dimethylallyltransferase MiaA [Candidatus Palauibacter soopunensis]|uniref:tRNA (adenosine(37)-N6)-dimethylallyltransferase MiaA n=1 Tax=Candidatus Palauibacter soopunensis TaxID=3056739 RepID=UPI00239852CA|nr:tRNA (adenosine(37)-N6)-dimethylallyltransferase MiaA [Candidatus Palauibacter soopunensis]MDE2880016.1 tRNA (adenosine(37)-N6)-dimethylallyltransferase MiaA [Candidatus Palauibacter soopunensis]
MPAIAGPTASGKTSVAIEVARRLDGEIISMDSRQAYRGFVIGTAAPSADQLAAAPHHGVGFLDPQERYGAGRFARLATRWLSEIRARGRVPILAGGTGLFLRALTHPMFEEPPLDPARRAALGAWLNRLEREELLRCATRLDPVLAARHRPLDRQRAARTVELALLTGEPLTRWMTRAPAERPPLRTATYVLEWPAPLLRERIARRAEALIRGGAWREEVRDLLACGLDGSRAFDALGYADVAALVRGEAGVDETIDRVSRATWRYARRQRTWFRHQVPENAVVLQALDESTTPGQLARRIATDWRESG